MLLNTNWQPFLRLTLRTIKDQNSIFLVRLRFLMGSLHQKKACQTLQKVNFDFRFLCIYFI